MNSLPVVTRAALLLLSSALCNCQRTAVNSASRSKVQAADSTDTNDRLSSHGPAPTQPPRASSTTRVGGHGVPSWFRIYDPLSWYLARPDEAPVGYDHLLGVPDVPTFPPEPFAEVWAYDVGASSLVRVPESVRQGVNGRGDLVYPGRPLSDDQAQRLLSIVPGVGAPSESREIQRPIVCQPSPATLFVFQDHHRVPVAVIEVSDGCLNWGFRPAPVAAWSRMRVATRHEANVIAGLCRQLGLIRCANADDRWVDSENQPESSQRDRQHEETLWLSEMREIRSALLDQPPPVPATLELRNASPWQRFLLCAWYARSASLTRSTFNGISRFVGLETFSLEYSTGETLVFQSLDGCIESFPECSESVASAASCIADQLQALDRASKACHDTCAWGLRLYPADQ